MGEAEVNDASENAVDVDADALCYIYPKKRKFLILAPNFYLKIEHKVFSSSCSSSCFPPFSPPAATAAVVLMMMVVSLAADFSHGRRIIAFCRLRRLFHFRSLF